MGLLRDALTFTHQEKQQQLQSILLGAGKGCSLKGSLMNLASTTTATLGTSESGSEPRNVMKTRAAKARDPPSTEANMVPSFIFPTQPEEQTSLQTHVERESKARITFPNSSANGQEPGPVLVAHQSNCS